MSEDADRWKVRFGQIFQKILVDSGKNLKDYFYFFPSGKHLDFKNKKSFNEVDLHINKELFNKYFLGNIKAFQTLNDQTVKRLDSTFVIVPGFGHHLIGQKAFGDQLSLLKKIGFDVLYVPYDDSFESNEKCAKRVYEIVRCEVDKSRRLIFFTYSKGSPVLVELLSTPDYSDVTNRTRAVVSFSGALRGSVLASTSSSRATLRLLKVYRRYSKKIGFSTKILRNLVRWTSKMPLNCLKEWSGLFEKAYELSNDLMDLPEGITDLMRVTSESKYSEVRLDDSIALFSISAVYPESVFKDGLAFISNLDDLFLYVSGRELYNYNVFNDTQILLPDSKFFPENGTIVDLGVVKTDHWGIALSRVFSRNYHDPFPRTEMIKSVLILLDEYFSQVKN